MFTGELQWNASIDTERMTNKVEVESLHGRAIGMGGKRSLAKLQTRNPDTIACLVIKAIRDILFRLLCSLDNLEA
jgi:hypothetical protein